MARPKPCRDKSWILAYEASYSRDIAANLVAHANDLIDFCGSRHVAFFGWHKQIRFAHRHIDYGNQSYHHLSKEQFHCKTKRDYK